MSIRQFVDGRAEKAGRFETSGSASRTGDCGTGGTGGKSRTSGTGETSGRASRKGVCKMFVLRHILGCASSPTFVRLSFAHRSLNVR